MNDSDGKPSRRLLSWRVTFLMQLSGDWAAGKMMFVWCSNDLAQPRILVPGRIKITGPIDARHPGCTNDGFPLLQAIKISLVSYCYEKTSRTLL